MINEPNDFMYTVIEYVKTENGWTAKATNKYFEEIFDAHFEMNLLESSNLDKDNVKYEVHKVPFVRTVANKSSR